MPNFYPTKPALQIAIGNSSSIINKDLVQELTYVLDENKIEFEDIQLNDNSNSNSSTDNGIEINFEVGWNMFGHCSNEAIDIEEFMDNYSYKIELIKDINGDFYWPDNNYNNIGSFNPGEGYLIKVNLPFSISY